MAHAKDHTGFKKGLLTLTRQAGKQGRAYMWEALCECGNTTFVVPSKQVKSCGCLLKKEMTQQKKDKLSKERTTDRSGHRNGRLVFTRSLGVVSKNVLWEAVCDCGNLTQTTQPLIVKSCGCLAKEKSRERMNKRKLPPEEKARRVREQTTKANKKRRQNPVVVFHGRISQSIRSTVLKMGIKKSKNTSQFLGYSAADLAAHLERQFVSGMSWDNRDQWHVDHIVPISTAKTLDDVIALNQLSNLRPIWKTDNLKKGAKRQFLI